MADYYSILKKTVSGLPANTAENRKLVFAKARSAIDRQLRAINPPPSDEAISRQMSALEAAIEQIEAENLLTAAARPVPPPPATAAAMETPVVRPQAEARPVVPAPPRERPASNSAPSPAMQQRPEARPARSEPVFDPASRPAAPAAPGQRPPAATLRPNPPPYDTSLDAVRDIERPVRVRQAPAARAAESGGGRSSALTMIVLLLVVLGLFAGGGYALWRNKDPLLAALGLGGPQQQQSQEVPAADPASETAPTDGDVAKEEARLGESGQAQPAPETDTAEDETPPAEEPGNLQPVEEPVAETPAEPAGEAAQVQPVEPVAPEGGQQPAQDAQTPAVEPAPTAEGQAQTASPAQAAIAQKAYLYEEGTSGAGATRDNAAVIWSLDQQPPADGMPPEPVIRGRVEVPGRGLLLDIIIKRNIDEALSASHIIELVFQAPPDFTGGSIDTVARFVMKANEQARGEGLVAVPVKIDTGYFLIALNNLEQAAATNKRLLLDSSWIDIPLGYTTGRRALVALEKGAIGDKVFRDAFADWDKR